MKQEICSEQQFVRELHDIIVEKQQYRLTKQGVESYSSSG
jgi:hypothetical protein